MKEFNLEEFKKNPSQKVVTRDGREVRIICTDRMSEFPIVALVFEKAQQEDIVITFPKDGKYAQRGEQPLDLFFAPTKREGWVNVFRNKEGSYTENSIYETEKRAKEVIGEKHKNFYVTTTKIEWEE